MLDECSPMEMEKGEKAKERDSTRSTRPALVVDSGSTVVLEPSEGIPSGVPRGWSTSLSSCNNDEETSWWGFWCCWLLQGRTAQSFEVDSSKKQITNFWCYIFAILFSALILGPPNAIVVAAIGGGVLAVNRAKLRWAIRRKLNISGSFASDFVIHCCCSCCAICQEAREEKAVLTRTLDFCSGEDLLVQERAHQRAIGHGEGISDSSIPEGGNVFTHIKSISQTSKLILMLSAVVASLSFLALVAAKKSQNIAVLFLVFLQPILILYFVYWRARRQYASLDFVVKCYAVGFWFTTFQSVILEFILQSIIILVLGPFFSPIGLDSGASVGGQNIRNRQNSEYSSNLRFSVNANVNTNSIGVSDVRASDSFRFHDLVSEAAKHVFFFHQPTVNQERFSSMRFSSNPGYPAGSLGSAGVFGGHYAVDVSGLGDDYGGAVTDPNYLVKAIARNHILLVILGLFLMAFVVAAGVEETMKHFIVRCCPFPSPLKDPHTVLVYLMAGALGFATSENIEYVFGTSASPIPGTSMFVGEIVVLLARVCMPIHVICSVLQASTLSKVLMGKSQMSLFMVLLPAILLHGAFDFTLFAMGAFEFIYDVQSTALEAASIAVAAGLTVGGAVYAYYAFKKVELDFKNGYGAFSQEEDDVVEVSL